jgi:hypothetical protein
MTNFCTPVLYFPKFKNKWSGVLIKPGSCSIWAGLFLFNAFTVIGTQVGIYGLARPDGGYANVSILNSKGKTVLNSSIDMYSKYPAELLKFLSPVFKKDTYTVTVTVLGERWWWKEKSGRLSGSKGDFISVERVVVSE